MTGFRGLELKDCSNLMVQIVADPTDFKVVTIALSIGPAFLIGCKVLKKLGVTATCVSGNVVFVVSIPTICSFLWLDPGHSHCATCPGIASATCISGNLSLVDIWSTINITKVRRLQYKRPTPMSFKRCSIDQVLHCKSATAIKFGI